MTTRPMEIVIRLQLELPPGMSLIAPAVTDEPLVYRVPAAAQKLGMSPSKLAELIARGDIESIKSDGTRLIPADALRAYVTRLAGGGDALVVPGVIHDMETAGPAPPGPAERSTSTIPAKGHADSDHDHDTRGQRRSA